MRKMSFIAAAAVAMTGCASTQTVRVAPNDWAVLADARIQTVQEDAPSFTPVRAKHAMLGLVGGIMMASKADGFAQTYGLVDPSVEIEAGLTGLLAVKHGAGPAQAPLDYRGRKKPKNLSSGADGLLLDVSTRGWGYNYFPMHMGRFRVGYDSVAVLADAKTGSVLGRHRCLVSTPEKPEDAPSIDELMANDAALLKASLKKLAQQCVTEINAALF